MAGADFAPALLALTSTPNFLAAARIRFQAWSRSTTHRGLASFRLHDFNRVCVAAAEHGIELSVVKLPKAKRGFVLLPRRWVVERSFAWATRFRRLAKDYERSAQVLAGLHLVAFTCIMLKQVVQLQFPNSL